MSEVVGRAIDYLLSLGDWRPKLRLSGLLREAESTYFLPFKDDLLQLQSNSGLFPLFWSSNEAESLRYTVLAQECLLSHKSPNTAMHLRTAHRALLSNQSIDGSWSELPDALWKLRRRQMHPGWSRELDKAELTCLVASSLRRTSGGPAKEPVGKAREWIKLFLQGQDFETGRSGDEYSLNPITLDIVVSTLLELGVEESRPSIDDAINLLRRSVTRSINRRASADPWNLLAGTKTLLSVNEDEDLLAQAAQVLIRLQQRDGGWRQGRVTGGSDSGELTLSALSFLIIQSPPLRRESERRIQESINLRRFIYSRLDENDETTRLTFLTRFEEVGIRKSHLLKHLLFECFLYSILEQFYWVTSDFDPQSEYLRITLEIGRLERVGLDKYADPQILRRALFRSQSLRGEASARKSDVAESTSLFATFLQSGEFPSFHEFTKALRAFTLAKAAEVAPSWKRDLLLGELLRLHSLHRNDPSSLMISLRDSLKCLPGVGEKVSSLFLYYVGHIFQIWNDIPLELLELPVDWNVVKPYAMLRLISVPLEKLKERPQLATDSIQQTAHEIFREDPVKLYGLWVVGHKWCARPWMCRDRAGNYCWLYAQCPYPQSRR